MGSPRLLVVFTGATALVVGAILALATGSWWLLALPVVLHAVATAVVLGMVFRRLGDDGDKPDPVTEARLEEEARAT